MVVIGGPPCQGISLMGKREVSDPRNDLLGEYVRLVKELQPRYFVMENVAGLTVGKYKNLLTSVIRELTEVGYNVAQPKVLQAAEFGTPQSRERLFLIGARSGFSVPNYPTPIYAPRRIDGKREESNTALPSGPSVSDALFDLPNADDYEELLLTDEVQVEYGTPSEYAARLRGMKRFEGDYSLARIFDPTIMTSSLRTKHTKKSIDRFSATSPGRTEPISRFLRLHPEGICNTLRAGTASDRGAHTAPRPIHPIYSRVITVRDAARLHGYPDWFRFHKTKWNGFREIGNSVPIPLGHAVASEIIKHEEIIPATKAAMELGPVELLSFSQTEAERFFGIESRVIPQRKRR